MTLQQSQCHQTWHPLVITQSWQKKNKKNSRLNSTRKKPTLKVFVCLFDFWSNMKIYKISSLNTSASQKQWYLCEPVNSANNCVKFHPNRIRIYIFPLKKKMLAAAKSITEKMVSQSSIKRQNSISSSIVYICIFITSIVSDKVYTALSADIIVSCILCI